MKTEQKLEQLRCPICNKRLFDADGKDYIISVKCRKCGKITVFKKTSFESEKNSNS